MHMNKLTAASLAPQDARREMPEPAIGKMQISQIPRLLAVRNLVNLHVPCDCGRPLVGLEFDFIHDTKGDAIYVRGVCLTCGMQQALYLGEDPKVSQEEHERRVREKAREAIDGIVTQVEQLRAEVLARTKTEAA
jgi:hypothetical protein